MALVTADSPHTVSHTVDRLIAALDRRGVIVFARIDHARGARAAGLELADEEVLVFGDPRAGTVLMQDDATIGLELPLRVLVWADAGGATKLAHRSPAELAQSYAVCEHADVLARMQGLLERLVAEAAAPD